MRKIRPIGVEVSPRILGDLGVETLGSDGSVMAKAKQMKGPPV
jgi:hypothetical protein